VTIIVHKYKKLSLKSGYRRHSCTSKTAKIHHFVRFVMYCFITTVTVAFLVFFTFMNDNGQQILLLLSYFVIGNEYM